MTSSSQLGLTRAFLNSALARLVISAQVRPTNERFNGFSTLQAGDAETNWRCEQKGDESWAKPKKVKISVKSEKTESVAASSRPKQSNHSNGKHRDSLESKESNPSLGFHLQLNRFFPDWSLAEVIFKTPDTYESLWVDAFILLKRELCWWPRGWLSWLITRGFTGSLLRSTQTFFLRTCCSKIIAFILNRLK